MEQLGIDIAKKKFDACLLIGKKTALKTFANTNGGFQELMRWLRKHGGSLHVCMEGTGRLWEPLAEFLHAHGYRVSVVNPLRIKGFAQSEMRRSKTDKIDASIIARFCQMQDPIAWTPPAEEVKAIRDMQRYVEALKANRTQEKNRLESGFLNAKVQHAIERHIEILNQQIKEMEAEILKVIEENPELKRNFELLVSINGVGICTAVTFLGELAADTRFSTAREVEVFCGMVPSLHESGSSVRSRPRLSKVGNSRIRGALYMPALCAMRTNPILREFASRLKLAGKKPKVVVCAVMRKLLRIMFAVVKHGRPFENDYRSSPPSGKLIAPLSP
jgi:transposase